MTCFNCDNELELVTVTHHNQKNYYWCEQCQIRFNEIGCIEVDTSELLLPLDELIKSL